MSDIRRALTGADIFTGDAVLHDHAVLIAHGRIAGVLPEAALPPGAPRRVLGGGLLAPGFIDMQVNGGGGALLNADRTAAAIRTIGAAHRRFGTTGFLPTVITDRRERIREAIAAVREAIAAGVPGVLGIHIEGPFISPERRGVHDARHVARPQEGDLDMLASLGRGVTLVTLAPECVPAGFVAALVARGVRVAAGHSAAGFAEAAAACAEGVTGFTHLFNGMPPFGAREPGLAGAALDGRDSWCTIVADGHHVHPAALRLALRAKRSGKLMLVTDAMPPVGTELSEFELQGRRILVRDGRCATEEGVLAGSVLDMAAAVRNMIALTPAGREEALRMASAYPAAALGLGGERGRIAAGCRADLVWLDDRMRVQATWIGGGHDLHQVTPRSEPLYEKIPASYASPAAPEGFE